MIEKKYQTLRTFPNSSRCIKNTPLCVIIIIIIIIIIIAIIIIAIIIIVIIIIIIVLILIIIIIVVVIIVITGLYWKHLNLTILRMKKKQLVMFAILNYIFENIYTIKKHPNYMIAIKNYFTICEY